MRWTDKTGASAGLARDFRGSDQHQITRAKACDFEVRRSSATRLQHLMAFAGSVRTDGTVDVPFHIGATVTGQKNTGSRRHLWGSSSAAGPLEQSSLTVPRAQRTAVVGLVLVLLSVPLLAFWGAYESLSAGFAAQAANEADKVFEEARYSVAWEESAERKYFLDPRPEVLREHGEAGEALDASLKKAMALEPGSSAMLTGLLEKHAKYRAFAKP